MIIEKASWNKVCNKYYNGEQNGVIDDEYLIMSQPNTNVQTNEFPLNCHMHDSMNYSIGECVVAIPISAVCYCSTNYDLSAYGFIKIGDSPYGIRWANKNYK